MTVQRILSETSRDSQRPGEAEDGPRPTFLDSSRDQERLLVRTVTQAPTIVEKMRLCSGDCQRPEETVTDRERLKMGVTDLNRRSWKGKNSYRLFQRPEETVIYNRYTPTIAEKMRRCSGDC